jgi:hypothetical protein
VRSRCAVARLGWMDAFGQSNWACFCGCWSDIEQTIQRLRPGLESLQDDSENNANGIFPTTKRLGGCSPASPQKHRIAAESQKQPINLITMQQQATHTTRRPPAPIGHRWSRHQAQARTTRLAALPRLSDLLGSLAGRGCVARAPQRRTWRPPAPSAERRALSARPAAGPPRPAPSGGSVTSCCSAWWRAAATPRAFPSWWTSWQPPAWRSGRSC